MLIRPDEEKIYEKFIASPTTQADITVFRSPLPYNYINNIRAISV